MLNVVFKYILVACLFLPEITFAELNASGYCECFCKSPSDPSMFGWGAPVSSDGEHAKALGQSKESCLSLTNQKGVSCRVKRTPTSPVAAGVCDDYRWKSGSWSNSPLDSDAGTQ